MKYISKISCKIASTAKNPYVKCATALGLYAAAAARVCGAYSTGSELVDGGIMILGFSVFLPLLLAGGLDASDKRYMERKIREETMA